MGLNTQFPSWVSQMPIAQQEVGQQMGRNILEGLRFQEQKRQYEEMKPMRDAQMELNRANTTSQILQNQQQLSALNRQNEVNASMAEALNLESGIARSQGGWTAPENKATYLDFMKRYPALSGTLWDQSMRKQFETADKMAFEERKYKEIIEGRRDVANITKAGAAGSQSRWLSAQQLIDEGVSPADAFMQVADSAQGAYAGKVKIAAEAMNSVLSGLEAAGIPLDDNLKMQLPSVWARFELGGQNLTGNQKLINQLSDEDTNYQMLDDVTKRIADFDKKYNKPGLFADYVGPLDNPRFQAQKFAIDPKDLSEADREAQDIFAQIDNIVQGYRREQFGTALTGSETAQFVKVLSTPNYANYVQSLNSFKNAIGNKLRINVPKNMFSPALDIGVKQRWYTAPQPVQSGSPVGQQNGRQVQGGVIGSPQPAPSGIKILGITPLP